MQTKKNIWIINQYAGSPIHGMEFRHYYLAKEFIKLGHNVSIISGSYSHLYKQQPAITSTYTFENIDGINYCWVKVPTYAKSISMGRFWNMLVFVLRLFFIPTRKFIKPDTIIVSSPSLFPILNGKLFANKFNAKLIFEVRDVWPLTLQELGNLSAKHPLVILLSWFEKYAYKVSNTVVSVLPGAKSHMLKGGLLNSNFNCIPNGIYIDDFVEQNIESEFQKNLAIPSSKFIVGYVGTIGLANALNYLIEAAAKLKDNKEIHFVIVGNGGEKNNLQALAQGLTNITFIDAVDKNKIPYLISELDVCYIGWHKQKLYELGISANKIFDYMYAGKPIIHSVNAYNDPIKESNCGISIDAENPEAIVQAILQLQQMSQEERIAIGNNGKKYVLEYHTYKALAFKYSSLF